MRAVRPDVVLPLAELGAAVVDAFESAVVKVLFQQEAEEKRSRMTVMMLNGCYHVFVASQVIFDTPQKTGMLSFPGTCSLSSNAVPKKRTASFGRACVHPASSSGILPGALRSILAVCLVIIGSGFNGKKADRH
jgi:hypothetical protein